MFLFLWFHNLLPRMKRNFLNVLLLLIGVHVFASDLPDGFVEKRLAKGLTPTSLLSLSPTQLIVTEKNGKVWLLKEDSLPTLLVKLPQVETYWERGLQNVLLDPDFASNGFLYFYYAFNDTVQKVVYNRVVRYTSTHLVVDTTSLKVIFNLSPVDAGVHNGGGMVFDEEGYLYITNGDDWKAPLCQEPDNFRGKVLRIHKDGSIPTDNPFYKTNTGDFRAVYALGLRNPFRLKKNKLNGKIYINDVGDAKSEEINELKKGANYGWPVIEGKRTNEALPIDYKDPLYTYSHDSNRCSITGGVFYVPDSVTYPEKYVGNYFFTDLCSGELRSIHPLDTSRSYLFGNFLESPVDLTVDKNGNIYYALYNTQEIWKISYAPDVPLFVSVEPEKKTALVGDQVMFQIKVFGQGQVFYQWFCNDSIIPDANTHELMLPPVTKNDSGAVYSVKIWNSIAEVQSTKAPLVVNSNQSPKAVIMSPVSSFLYSAGTSLNFSGVAVDPDDGELDESAFQWKIDFHHNDHKHPALESYVGKKEGAFFIPDFGETSDNVWLRIYLVVTDRKGATDTAYQDIFPRKGQLWISTEPAGLPLLLDGHPVPNPSKLTSVVGLKRSIEALSLVKTDSISYMFAGWKNGQNRKALFSTDTGIALWVAKYVAVTLDTLLAVADANVQSESLTSFTLMNIDSTLVYAPMTDATIKQRAYVRFAIPHGDHVRGALVQLASQQYYADSLGKNLIVYSVYDSTWQEKTIDWTTMPLLIDSVAAPPLPWKTQKYGGYEWDVTNYYNEQSLAGSHSLSLAITDTGSLSFRGFSFSSKEGFESPKLILIKDYETPSSVEASVSRDAHLVLQPNPVAGIQRVRLHSSHRLLRIALMSLAGELIDVPITIDNDNAWLETRLLPAGIYLLNITTNEGLFVKKLVVGQ